MHPNEKPQPQPTMVETVGVTIRFRAPADAELHIKVPKGEFSFRPMDMPEAEGIFPLAATVEVYRTPLVEQVTDSEYEDDYPALAADGDSLWLSWQGYKNESDQVFLRNYSGGRWGERITVTEKPADIFMSGVSACQWEGDRGLVRARWRELASEGPQLQHRRRREDRNTHDRPPATTCSTASPPIRRATPTWPIKAGGTGAATSICAAR